MHWKGSGIQAHLRLCPNSVLGRAVPYIQQRRILLVYMRPANDDLEVCQRRSRYEPYTATLTDRTGTTRRRRKFVGSKHDIGRSLTSGQTSPLRQNGRSGFSLPQPVSVIRPRSRCQPSRYGYDYGYDPCSYLTLRDIL
jgi:hypothetical protein